MSIYKKLNDFKSKVGTVRKDGNNPFHGNKYATIESVLQTIEKPLEDSGLCFYQLPQETGLKTVVFSVEDNESIESFILYIGANDMQKLGSAITYARRFALVTMLGLEQDDDDGNYASGYNPQQQYNNSAKEHISLEQAKGLAQYLTEQNQDLTKLMQFFKIKKLSELTIAQYQFAMNKTKQGDFK